MTDCCYPYAGIIRIRSMGLRRKRTLSKKLPRVIVRFIITQPVKSVKTQTSRHRHACGGNIVDVYYIIYSAAWISCTCGL